MATAGQVIIGILLGVTGVAAIIVIAEKMKKPASTNSGNGNNPSFPTGTFTPGGSTGSGSSTPTPPAGPQPNPNTFPYSVTVLAQNGNYQTFIVTADDFNALENEIGSTTGYISASFASEGSAINATLAQVLAYITTNVIPPEVIPNIKFDLQAPNNQWMKGIILTQDDWTTFRAQFPTGIGVYNVSDTNNAETETVAQLANFIYANQG